MNPIYKRIQEVLGTTNAAEIGRKLGYGKHLVYKWRDGRGLPRIDTFLEIWKLTNSSLHWLLTGEGEKYVGRNVTTVTKSIASEAVPVDTDGGDWKLFSSLVDGQLHIRLQRGDVEISYIIASVTHDFK